MAHATKHTFTVTKATKRDFLLEYEGKHVLRITLPTRGDPKTTTSYPFGLTGWELNDLRYAITRYLEETPVAEWGAVA